MSEAFIKRGDKVHGPFSESQIKAGLKSGKLSQKDLVSKDRSGPWRPIKIESRSEPAVAKTEDDVLGWLGDAKAAATSRAEDEKTARNADYQEWIEGERQASTATSTKAPTAKTQAASDSDVIYEDEQIRITEQRINVNKTAEKISEHNDFYEEVVKQWSCKIGHISHIATFSTVRVCPPKTRVMVASILRGAYVVSIITVLVFLALMFQYGFSFGNWPLPAVILFVGMCLTGFFSFFFASSLYAKSKICECVQITSGGDQIFVPFERTQDAMAVSNVLNDLI